MLPDTVRGVRQRPAPPRQAPPRTATGDVPARRAGVRRPAARPWPATVTAAAALAGLGRAAIALGRPPLGPGTAFRAHSGTPALIPETAGCFPRAGRRHVAHVRSCRPIFRPPALSAGPTQDTAGQRDNDGKRPWPQPSAPMSGRCFRRLSGRTDQGLRLDTMRPVANSRRPPRRGMRAGSANFSGAVRKVTACRK